MPGLSQLKKFSADILSLGDEPGLRAARGEKPVTVPLPKGIEDKDDSDDFITGMPEPVDYDVKPEKKVVVEEDFSDIMGTSAPKPQQQAEAPAEASFTVPDLSSLGDLSAFGSDEGSGDEGPDLSMFADPIEETAPEPEPEPEEPEISDLSLEDLLGGTGFDGSEGTEEEKDEEPEEELSIPDSMDSAEDVSIEEIKAENDRSTDSSSEEVDSAEEEFNRLMAGNAPERQEAPAAEEVHEPLEEEPFGDLDLNMDSLELDPSAEAGNTFDSEDFSGLADLDSADGAGDFELDDSVLSNEEEFGKTEINSADPLAASLFEDAEELTADEEPGAAEELTESDDGFFDLESLVSDDNGSSGASDEVTFSPEDFDNDELFNKEEKPAQKTNRIPIEQVPDFLDIDSIVLTDSRTSPAENEGSDQNAGTEQNKAAVPEAEPEDDADFMADVIDETPVEEIISDDVPASEDEPVVEEPLSVEDVSEAEEAPVTEDFAADDFSFGDGNDSIKEGTFAPVDSADASELDSFSLDDLDDFNADSAAAGGLEEPAVSEPLENDDGADSLSAVLSENLDDSDDELSVPETETSSEDADEFSIPDFSFDDEVKKSPEAFETDSEFATGGEEIDMGSGLPEEISEVPPEMNDSSADGAGSGVGPGAEDSSFDLSDLNFDEASAADSVSDGAASGEENPFGDMDLGGLDLPDSEAPAGEAGAGIDTEDAGGTPAGLFDVNDFDMPDLSTDDLGDSAPAAAEENAGDDSSSESDFGTDDSAGTDSLFGSDTDFSLDDMDSGTGSSDSVPEQESAGSSDMSGSTNLGDDFPADFNFDLSDSSDDSADNFTESAPSETFDTSDMEGLDFGIQETDSHINQNGDFELGSSDEFGMDNGDFEIPGFSDVDEVQVNKNGKIKVADQASKEEETETSDLPPNTLSDDQYEHFLKNLAGYPLNVRIAVEELIVKNEFTDEAEFDIVRKVLKKVSARQLASELEKMLDISIPVPRDFERRTAEEYEAYKQSFQYQLKNKIIPGSIVSIAAVIVCFFMFQFTKNFIYKPARAAALYRQGYVLLESEDFPQSESKFNEATKYSLQRKWFFRYAHGYQDHKQYIRAENMYKKILYCFNHDKQAGLEYAYMELNDLANYEKAEQVLLREVLDHHVNDQDGMLLLGDNYLEWATEKNPEKFSDARRCYSELIQLYGNNQKNMDLFSSRMMRYFIRTDNLLEVLTLKNRFYPRPRSLGAEDWTSLSGYLLDKLYGPLAPADEYLRSKIEDVKKMLVRAVKADPSNPVALYNISRYFIHMNNGMNAKSSLIQALNAFDNVKKLKRTDVYKNIDSYRLLGEEYVKDKDYLKAMESYSNGIALFSRENIGNGLEGNSSIGNLYADYGDIEYFISGDMDSALTSYQDAVDNFYDRGEIRYKIGFIQYSKKRYQDAVGSFMKAGEDFPDDPSLLLAMGNTLSLRNDNYAAQSYYQRLLSQLEDAKTEKGILFPQVRNDEAVIVDNYMKASNNFGVTLFKLAKRTGSSALNAEAIVKFQNSLRAWDSMTRNQQSMVRLGGSNLAEQNISYVIHPMPDYEPAIYTDIPKVLEAEEGLIQ